MVVSFEKVKEEWIQKKLSESKPNEKLLYMKELFRFRRFMLSKKIYKPTKRISNITRYVI